MRRVLILVYADFQTCRHYVKEISVLMKNRRQILRVLQRIDICLQEKSGMAVWSSHLHSTC